jgi:hypothetical protein
MKHGVRGAIRSGVSQSIVICVLLVIIAGTLWTPALFKSNTLARSLSRAKIVQAVNKKFREERCVPNKLRFELSNGDAVIAKLIATDPPTVLRYEYVIGSEHQGVVTVSLKEIVKRPCKE